jgi:type I restriction enzyme S subunit
MNYKKGLTQEFMYHYFSFEQRRVVSFGSGSIFKNLKTDYIKNLKIALPPKLILEKICPKFKEISELISIKSQENQQLTQLRDWLLPMLMNGQITIK